MSDYYYWKKEIVLVTGGSSEIGNLVVRDFAAREVEVIACDLNEPKTPLRTYFPLQFPFGDEIQREERG